MQTFAIIMLVIIIMWLMFLYSWIMKHFWETSYKDFWDWFFVIPITLFFVCIFGISFNINYEWSNKPKQEYKIDLPEEIDTISIDKSKPDTILGYKHGDSLIFKFH